MALSDLISIGFGYENGLSSYLVPDTTAMLPPFSLVIDLASSGLHFPFDPVGHLSRLHKATPVSCRSLESLAAQVRLHYLSAIPDPLVAQIFDGLICRFTVSKALPCLLSPRLCSVLHCSAYY